MAINFFTEDVPFKLSHKIKRKNWLKKIAKSENHEILNLNYIFCSDEYLHKINLQYLNHDDYTDIITFDNSEEPGRLEGDIFISIERVMDNSKSLDTSLEKELARVLSHGLFHLMGQKDKSDKEAAAMREKEEYAIELFEKS